MCQLSRPELASIPENATMLGLKSYIESFILWKQNPWQSFSHKLKSKKKYVKLAAQCTSPLQIRKLIALLNLSVLKFAFVDICWHSPTSDQGNIQNPRQQTNAPKFLWAGSHIFNVYLEIDLIVLFIFSWRGVLLEQRCRHGVTLQPLQGKRRELQDLKWARHICDKKHKCSRYL